MATRSGDVFNLLVVCTGNVCRSPALERLLVAGLDEGGLRVHSGGTRALVGEPIHPPMERLLQGQGVSGDNFAARLLTESMISQADLILTATREHRADVVEESPAALRRTFSVREFARLAAQVDLAQVDAAVGADARAGERLTALVPLAAAHRAQVPAELDDIVDPYQRSDEVYQHSFAQIDEAVRTIVQAVSGAPPTGTPSTG